MASNLVQVPGRSSPDWSFTHSIQFLRYRSYQRRQSLSLDQLPTAREVKPTRCSQGFSVLILMGTIPYRWYLPEIGSETTASLSTGTKSRTRPPCLWIYQNSSAAIGVTPVHISGSCERFTNHPQPSNAGDFCWASLEVVTKFPKSREDAVPRLWLLH